MPQQTAKIRTALYDEVILADDALDECLYCLTKGQVRMLLSQMDIFGWETRFYTTSGAFIDGKKLRENQADLTKRLIMSCCGEEQNQSITYQVLGAEGNYAMQVSYDGGTTWETDNSDPRITYTSQQPLPDDTPDLKCQAAWNLRKAFEDIVPAIASVLGATLSLFAVAVAVGGVLLSFLLSPLDPLKYAPVVINLVGYLLGLSETEFASAFNTSDYEKLQCAAYCLMNDQGQITDLGAFVDKICELVDCNTIPGNTFKLLAYAMGLIFINSAAATMHGTNTYDCTTCECTDLCGNDWIIDPDAAPFYAGMEIIDQGEGFVTVKSGTFSGNYRIYIQSAGGLSDCCRIADLSTDGVEGWEVISGSMTSTPPQVECGDSDPNHFQSYVQGRCCWKIQFQCNAADTVVKINLRNC